MAGPFHSLSIATSGMNVYQSWLDAVADNVSNLNTVRRTDEAAFQERFLVARSAQSPDGRPGGSVIDRAEFGNPLGRLVHDPLHPLADDEGFVRMPAMDLSDQMTHLLMAQRGYQANVAAFERARDAYQRALEIGR
jgi:flagellar basal-body rod protein FlgC